MHIYLIKSRLTNSIIHVFEAADNSDAYSIMECLGSGYYLERISSYTTSVVGDYLDEE